jgi:hypothetical protein
MSHFFWAFGKNNRADAHGNYNAAVALSEAHPRA